MCLWGSCLRHVACKGWLSSTSLADWGVPPLESLKQFSWAVNVGCEIKESRFRLNECFSTGTECFLLRRFFCTIIYLGARTGKFSSVIFKSRAVLRSSLSYSPSFAFTFICFLVIYYRGNGNRDGDPDGEFFYLELLIEDCEPFSNI